MITILYYISIIILWSSMIYFILDVINDKSDTEINSGIYDDE